MMYDWIKIKHPTLNKYVSLQDNVTGFQRILEGEFDSYPEQAFYLVGGIDDVIEKASGLNE